MSFLWISSGEKIFARPPRSAGRRLVRIEILSFYAFASMLLSDVGLILVLPYLSNRQEERL